MHGNLSRIAIDLTVLSKEILINTQSSLDIVVATNEVVVRESGDDNEFAEPQEGSLTVDRVKSKQGLKQVDDTGGVRLSGRIAMKAKTSSQPSIDKDKGANFDPKPKRVSKKASVAQERAAQRAIDERKKEQLREAEKVKESQRAEIKREVEKAVKQTTISMTKLQNQSEKEARDRSEQEIKRLGKIVTEQAAQLSSLQKAMLSLTLPLSLPLSLSLFFSCAFSLSLFLTSNSFNLISSGSEKGKCSFTPINIIIVAIIVIFVR